MSGSTGKKISSFPRRFQNQIARNLYFSASEQKQRRKLVYFSLTTKPFMSALDQVEESGRLNISGIKGQNQKLPTMFGAGLLQWHKYKINMETKFTKGEWMIAENHIKGNHYQYSILGNGTTMVADVMRHNFKQVGKSKFKDENTLYPCKESEANAKLIASAPEMLEALQILVGDIEKSPVKFTREEKIEIARKAIKKAI